MNSIARLIGITMVGTAAGTMLLGIQMGICIGLLVSGFGLVVDSLRK